MAEHYHHHHHHSDEPDPSVQSPETLGPGAASLSEALRVSFVVLKVIMVVLVGIFIFSGFRLIGPDEQALVLRFGKIRGVGEKRILGPGLHWVFPYPIDEIVKIPVEKKINLAINSFWYYQSQEEIISEQKRRVRIDEPLRPAVDGYCLTRSEQRGHQMPGFSGSDYTIVHCKWQVTYQIEDPERFFRNVYVADMMPGESYFDVMTESIQPMLTALFEDCVVTTMVNYTIDQARSSDSRITADIRNMLQEKLQTIESGIKIISVQFDSSPRWPRQVDEAFERYLSASQNRKQLITEAKLYAEKTLNQAGGPVADELVDTLKADAADADRDRRLWDQLAGQAQEKIAEARAYRTSVVENARANAEYLNTILPEYRKRPELVLQRIYQDAVEGILEQVDEKIVIQPSSGEGEREIRVMINRDPKIKTETERNQ